MEIPVEVICKMAYATRNRAITDENMQDTLHYKEQGPDDQFDYCTRDVLVEP